MARLDQMPEPMRSHLYKLPCPTFESTPWTPAPPLDRARVAMVTTAGLHERGDRPFDGFAGDYRVIPGDVQARDLVMSHISTNFDRSGFSMDLNVVFPIDRLRELEAEGFIGAVADNHYSFMGATDPAMMESAVAEVAGRLKQDGVTAVLLVPV